MWICVNKNVIKGVQLITMERPSVKHPLSEFTISKVFVQCFKVRQSESPVS